MAVSRLAQDSNHHSLGSSVSGLHRDPSPFAAVRSLSRVLAQQRENGIAELQNKHPTKVRLSRFAVFLTLVVRAPARDCMKQKQYGQGTFCKATAVFGLTMAIIPCFVCTLKMGTCSQLVLRI